MSLTDLCSLKIENGAPFPFTVEVLKDLASWKPKVRCIAVCPESKTFRVDCQKGGEVTAGALKTLVLNHCGPDWKEHKMIVNPPKTTTKTQPEKA